jgi:hypothetical protein
MFTGMKRGNYTSFKIKAMFKLVLLAQRSGGWSCRRRAARNGELVVAWVVSGVVIRTRGATSAAVRKLRQVWVQERGVEALEVEDVTNVNDHSPDIDAPHSLQDECLQLGDRLPVVLLQVPLDHSKNAVDVLVSVA